VTTSRLHHPRGTLAQGGWSLVMTPELAGWGHAGLRIAELAPGGSTTFDTGLDEAVVLPLEGGAAVTVEGSTIDLAGRTSPFAGPTDFAYIPRGVRAVIGSTTGARIAVCTARASADLPFRHASASSVAVELRGAGATSRAVRAFAMPDTFEADALIACEVITPAGNWSSYPPHKHDEPGEHETILEELYYYEVAAGPSGPGIAYQRVYGTPDRPIDLLVEVRDGDLVLIPHGWHGPAMAAPGYDLYYLNVMAGPGAERAWRITDDPDHAWIRDTWRDQAVDPRLTG
jgi:5-deoxy-glucuronate isomerase